MRRPYTKPKIERIPIRSDQAVAGICWAYAKNGKEFYHDVPGYGYARVHVVAHSGCSSTTDFVIEFPEELNMSSAQIVAAEKFLIDHLHEVRAQYSNNATAFKNSEFEKNPSPEWS